MDQDRNRTQLDGKVAVVTGGTQGLGEAIARLFAERGGRASSSAAATPSEARAVAADLARQGCRAEFVRADLAASTTRAP